LIARGIDGCRGGWIAVSIDAADRRDFAIFSAIAEVLVLGAATTMIDIPIGLPERGYRGCDREARRLLKGAASRVFLGLRRPLLGCLSDYPAANAWGKKTDGKGLAKQAFNILPKIAEVDAVITPALQERFRESHPELVFARMNGGTPLASKHEAEGLRQRHDLLMRHGFAALDAWLARLRGTGAKPDDLYDACVLALAARDAMAGDAQRIGAGEARDAKGLRMEIWY